MERGKKGFFLPVLFSLICLPIVSAILLGIRYKKASLADRNGSLLPVAAGFHLFVGISALLLILTGPSESNERYWDLQDQGYSVTQLDSMIALPDNVGDNEIRKPSYTRDGDQQFRIIWMIFWSGIPYLVAGIFLILIRTKLNRLNASIDMLVNLVNAGGRDLDELQSNLPYPIDPNELAKQIVTFKLLPDYVVDFKSNSLKHVRAFERDNTVVKISWECSSCQASNSVRIKRTEIPKCEFCGTPKI